MRRVLVVTNDFPPRQGGIQSFVHELAVRQPAGSVVVYAANHRDAPAFDAQQPFPVIRHSSGTLLPTPAARDRISAVLREQGCTAVWFGASAPLGLLAPALRAAGAGRLVASTHGHEVGWAMLPGGRGALQRIGRDCDVVTYLGEYTRGRLAKAFGPDSELRQLTPGVDTAVFHPGVSGASVRERYRLGDRPVIVCVSRLVARKGQDELIRALPEVRRAVPGTAVLLVGAGRYRDSLERLAQRCGVADDVVLTGGVPHAELAAHYAAGTVFAMPCRTRWAGMDLEGLGIVYLEASAIGLPVIAGRSGGAPDAVVADETGLVVDGRDRAALTASLVRMLRDGALRERFGAAGRAWVEREWRWDVLAGRLTELLQS